MKRLTLMVRIDDTARADIALTPERTYYRFATDSSIEDGQLAPVEVDYESLIKSAKAREGEAPLAQGVLVQIFEDNRRCPVQISEPGLSRLVDALVPLAPEFAFMAGFKG